MYKVTVRVLPEKKGDPTTKTFYLAAREVEEFASLNPSFAIETLSWYTKVHEEEGQASQKL